MDSPKSPQTDIYQCSAMPNCTLSFKMYVGQGYKYGEEPGMFKVGLTKLQLKTPVFKEAYKIKNTYQWIFLAK